MLTDAPATDDAPQRREREATMQSSRYSLRFISGKYQGGEFPLPARGEVFIGRSSELDMVLVEDMVSRKHAVIRMEGHSIEVEDLGSTNGSFVNGERIQKAALSEGDRLLIGTSIIRVVRTDGNEVRSSTLAEQAEANTENRTMTSHAMTGSIAEVPLTDLLQLFSAAKKTGLLSIRTDTDVGEVWIENGIVVYASVNGNEDIEPRKSVYRILTWRDGYFEMASTEARDFPERMEVPTEALLMEAMRQKDELARLSSEMPAMSAHLSVSVPLVAPLRDLTPDQLDIVQLAHNYGHVETILNRAPQGDLEASRIIVELVQRNYLHVD